MANRGYLYSINAKPTADESNPKIIGLSEWSYIVPLSHQILLSGAPQQCRSVIWDGDEHIAIIGDYEEGLQKFELFCTQLTSLLPDLTPVCQEAVEFLRQPANKQAFFLLEAGEIFMMSDDELSTQSETLFQSILDVDKEITLLLEQLKTQTSHSSTKHQTRTEQNQMLYELGLDNWFNVLYFDFGERAASENLFEEETVVHREQPTQPKAAYDKHKRPFNPFSDFVFYTTTGIIFAGFLVLLFTDSPLVDFSEVTVFQVGLYVLAAFVIVTILVAAIKYLIEKMLRSG
ncbi:MAG: hypothetical protein GFH27_549319n108 [Chloroflexi bacterium AL-W]|nr:hypothetical protein [Chloroflexi bacterium AL-N1]NOK71271.1 hypothetical protein [Chloroflexi bacterium AL-N10]NOK77646.1 hypothetical protein [Chloroflexi bacterium AL-N5]NOK84497.1 hypothetical protein [Chloroflexi bacterium AL-W]NOK92948.1 hypothetical protein [Chloroflexi bacterium AL-N15]